MLGTRTIIKGRLVNVHNLTVAAGAQMDLHDTAQTAYVENGTYTHLTQEGNISLSHLVIQRDSGVSFIENSGSLVVQIIKVTLNYEALVMMNKGKILSDSAVIESKALVELAYRGYGSELGEGRGTCPLAADGMGCGAGHGGHGGAPEPLTGGDYYDSMVSPSHCGSGGGNGADGGLGGSGGGYLHWINGNDLLLDGTISLIGQDGQANNGGGGSGGAILIDTLNFTGFGHIDVNGGAGCPEGKGAGGAGGRISVRMEFANRFGGRLTAFGGQGSGGAPAAAAGTVYLEETSRGPQYEDVKYDADTGQSYKVAAHRRLEVNNDDNDKSRYTDHAMPWLYTVIDEGEKEKYDLDEAILEKHANLMIAYSSRSTTVEVSIHRFDGDRTGQFRVLKDQKLFVEVKESSRTNETLAPCSFFADENSTIVFTDKFTMLGTRTVIKGLIAGVSHLLIGKGADVLFFSTAQTALYENGELVMITEHGNFTFGILQVLRNSYVEFQETAHQMSITVSDLLVKYEGLIKMNSALLEVSNGILESGGTIDMSGGGYGAASGPGKGFTSDGKGLGAGHGGYGGGELEGELGGAPYDSYHIPGESGSGGGNGSGTGGAGGGFLQWFAGDLIELDGLLTLAGLNGEGQNAGGGSGGALYMKTTNMTGHGTIAINGGNGTDTGTGGAGGRVAIHCRWRYQYGGVFSNYGGVGGSQGSNQTAASGTNYKEENLRPLQYRETKYDLIRNTTYLKVDHTYVNSDNIGRTAQAYTLLQDDDRKEVYELDEMELTGSATLRIYHPSGSSGVTVIVHRFIGDKTGQLYIGNNQQVFVEVVESTSNRTEAPCSFEIDAGGEIHFPSEVHVRGTQTVLAGQITGILDLHILDGADFEVKSTANTAQKYNGTYFNVQKNGSVSMDKLSVKQGGTAGFTKVTEELFIQLSELMVKYGGNLYMNRASINTSHAWIESGGVFHFNAKGHVSEAGPGKGFTLDGVGFGGSHGGFGGGPDPELSPPPYDSVKEPREAGSGGGNGGGIGGHGGGSLVWYNGQRFELDGLIALQGQSGVGGNAGGGSGGSLLVYTTNFTGHGEANQAGGDAAGVGGGGSGGRTAIHCRFRYSFGGKFNNMGGKGGPGLEAINGGPAGTAYVENNLRPLEYRILKYVKATNITYFQVDYR